MEIDHETGPLWLEILEEDERQILEEEASQRSGESKAFRRQQKPWVKTGLYLLVARLGLTQKQSPVQRSHPLGTMSRQLTVCVSKFESILCTLFRVTSIIEVRCLEMKNRAAKNQIHGSHLNVQVGIRLEQLLIDWLELAHN
jgi:hypothetical protein